MISHKHKCIFVEIPKTGSTSVRAILGKAWKPHLNLWQIKQLMETSWTEFGGRKNRIMAALYLLQSEERRRETGRRQFESYFKFGFVRNPWDRVVSLYERSEALQLRNEMSFEEFVDWIQYSSATCVHSSPHRYQLDWFVDANGNLLADFVGKYERLWPDHPFIFHVPYQELRGTDSDRIKYHPAPEDIKGTVLHLLADIDDEEWIYWCVDDKYPIQLPTDKVAGLISHAMRSPGIDGLLFCRCRALLSIPALTLHPKKVKNLFGDVYLERKGWWQIWIHQIMRAKVLRHLFKNLPDHIPSAKAMDDLKDDVPKLPEHRLFVTENNYAVFGEIEGQPFISNLVFIGRGTVVEQGAVLKGPAWIGENCQIRSGCYVRENVIAGDGVVMGNSCEFKNCILFDEAQVPHFNYVGDSILGHQAHLGAGVILSNVKLNHAEIAVSTPDGDIPTGLRKFGAIVGDRTEI